MCCSDSDQCSSAPQPLYPFPWSRKELRWPGHLCSGVMSAWPVLRTWQADISSPVMSGKLFVPAKVYSCSTLSTIFHMEWKCGAFSAAMSPPVMSSLNWTAQDPQSFLQNKFFLYLLAFPLDFLFLLKICCVKRHHFAFDNQCFLREPGDVIAGGQKPLRFRQIKLSCYK